jgi:hypothetical protein
LAGLGASDAHRVHALAERAARWESASDEKCAFLLPKCLLNGDCAGCAKERTGDEARILEVLEQEQLLLLEEAHNSQESLRDTKRQQREDLAAAFFKMQSGPLANLSDIFALTRTYGVLEARLAYIEAKSFMRFAATLRKEQRHALTAVLR